MKLSEEVTATKRYVPDGALLVLPAVEARGATCAVQKDRSNPFHPAQLYELEVHILNRNKTMYEL
jgi:hypothetical protein